MNDVNWLSEPEEHDYPAAGDYLSLLARSDLVAALVDALRRAGTVSHKAKDLLRASGLPLLPPEDEHVASDLRKIKKETALSPILLVRGDIADRRLLVIADGYHRVCASYHTDSNTPVPCRIVDVPRQD
jgi:hypothetical protein